MRAREQVGSELDGGRATRNRAERFAINHAAWPALMYPAVHVYVNRCSNKLAGGRYDAPHDRRGIQQARRRWRVTLDANGADVLVSDLLQQVIDGATLSDFA